MTTIIVGTDLSENALDAARWAFGLADLTDDAEVLVVHVVEADDLEIRRTVSGHSEQKEIREVEGKVDGWLDDVDTEGVDFDIEVPVGRQARKLSELAERRDADWLVVGKSGKGRIARLFVGSTTENLAMRPPCPMAIIHPDGFTWDESLELLAAVDLSSSSVDAAARGAEILRRHRGRMTLLHVIALPQGTAPLVEGPHTLPETLDEHIDQSTSWARDELEAALADHRVSFDDVSPTIEIRPGYPIHEVLHAIDDRDVNLLALGSQGRSRLADFVLGGIGRSLLKKAPCNVILAPPNKTDS